MKRYLDSSNIMRYARQVSLLGFDLEKQEILLNSKVLIIGAGGLGCAASQYLAAAGIGEITIADDDIVELSNLQRQILHFEQDIGIKKVLSAKASLHNINQTLRVNTLEQRQDLDSLEHSVAKHDLVLDCSDNLETRLALNEVCYRLGVAMVSGAAIRMEGQIFCMQPKAKTSCYTCLAELIGEQELSCTEAGVMSPVVGIVGATQAVEAIKILTNFGENPYNTLLLYDAMASSWDNFKLVKNPSCKTCGSL